MTAKNRIILSVIAIITTLVVAGSMVFIIFAATRGTIGAGLTIEYSFSKQFEGTITTRYTTTPLATGFGNGEGDSILKTADGKDYIELKGWQTTQTSFEMEELNLEFDIDNTWVIFEHNYDFSDMGTGGGWLINYISLASGTTMRNMKLTVFGGAGVQMQNDKSISPERFEQLEWARTFTWTEDNISEEYSDFIEHNPIYVMISIIDPYQEASFSGGVTLSSSLYL